MKKQFLAFALLVFSTTVFSQDIIRLKDSRKVLKTDREPQLIYVGLGGPAVGLSLNYDRRFNKQVDGLGFNVGIGTSVSSNIIKYTTIPFGLNYLLGNTSRGKYFEIGLTQSILMTGDVGTGWFSSSSLASVLLQSNKTYTFTNFTIGYRSQPNEGGFNFRGGLNPIIFEGKTDLGAYLTFGYNF